MMTRSKSSAVAPGGNRRIINVESEHALIEELRGRGHSVDGCCDFRQDIKRTADALARFGNIDVCMGIHGAGLGNCIFGPPGMVIFEVQVRFHNFGFDGFMKISDIPKSTIEPILKDVKLEN